MPSPTVVKFALLPTILGLFCAVALVVFAAALLAFADSQTSLGLWAALAFMLALSVVFGACMAARIFLGLVAVRLDDKGFCDNTSMFASYRVGWGNVAGFVPFSVSHQKGIAVMLKDNSVLYRENPGLWRYITFALAQRVTGTPALVNTRALNLRTSEMQQLMQEHWLRAHDHSSGSVLAP